MCIYFAKSQKPIANCQTMDIIPAIDIIDGKCVRLFKGDYNEKKIYHSSPADQAKIFEDQGADVIHVVDLDGAKAKTLVNRESIEAIRKRVSVPIEVGGGIRDIESARSLFDIGVDRVILGTIAVENPELVQSLIREFGVEKIVLGIDAKQGKVAVNGWEESTELEMIDFAEKMVNDYGVKWIIYTDIFRDGTLTHPNFDDYDRLVNVLPDAHIIASGGVSKVSHIDTLRDIGVAGVIIGKALYERKFRLTDIVQ